MNTIHIHNNKWKQFILSHKEQLILLVATLILVQVVLPDSYIYGSKVDWLSQHVEFPDYFRKLFYEEHQLFPSLATALGGGQNFAQFTYYGWMRPDVLLSFAFPWISMSSWMSFAGIAYVVVAVQVCYLWLSTHVHKRSAFLTSILFLCSGPILFHSHRHIMFISSFPALFIALWGCDDWVNKGRKGKLILGVFFMIICSYFYSVGGLLAIFLYGLWAMKHRDTNIGVVSKKTLQFIDLLGLGVLLSGFLLIPTAYAILLEPREALQEVALMDLFQLENGMNALYYDAYNVGLTAIGGVSLLYFLFVRKHNLRFLSVGLLVILCIPFFQFVLNGMQYVRAKSLLPFLPLCLCLVAYFLDEIPVMKKKQFIMAVFFTSIQFIFMEDMKGILLVMDAVFLTLLLMRKKRTMMYIYLGIPVVVCLIVNQKEEFAQVSDVDTSIKDTLVLEVLQEDKGIYRFDDMDATRYANHVASASMYRTSLYSSNSNNTYNQFYYETMKAPAESSNHILLPVGIQPYFQYVMGVKYLYGACDVLPSTYQVIKKEKNACVGKNDNVLPLMYLSNTEMREEAYQQLSFPYNLAAFTQYSVVSDTTNPISIPSVQSIKITPNIKENTHLQIQNEENGIHIKADKTTSTRFKLHKAMKNKYLVLQFRVRDIKNGTKVRIEIDHIGNTKGVVGGVYSDKNDVFTYVLEGDKVEDVGISFSKGDYHLTQLKAWSLDKIRNTSVASPIPLTKEKGNMVLSSRFTSQRDSYLITSFPYQKGFHFIVDGKDSLVERVNSAFVGTKIKAGTHEVQLVYEQPGQRLGIFVSVGSILFIVCLSGFKRYKKQ